MAQSTVAGHGVEELVINGRKDDTIQATTQFRKLRSQSCTPLGQLKELRHLVLNGANVGNQRVGVSTDARKAFILRISPLQDGQLFLEGGMRVSDAGSHPGKVLGGLGSG